jgi:hypothetical protein
MLHAASAVGDAPARADSPSAMAPGEYVSAVSDEVKRAEAERSPQKPAREESALQLALGIGLVLALISLLIGLSMAFSSEVAPCENGHFFPEGTTDFTCYAHPQTGVGSAIVLFSILIGILLVFSAIPALATVRTRATEPRA